MLSFENVGIKGKSCEGFLITVAHKFEYFLDNKLLFNKAQTRIKSPKFLPNYQNCRNPYASAGL